MTSSITPSIKSKLPQTGTTIFTVMSALAQQHQAINLAQGFPDFPCDPALIRKVTEAMEAGHNQYAPMPGLMSLREAIAEKIFNLYSAQYHPESEITIVPGGTVGLYAAITAVVREGDEVIVIEPCYDSYIPAIRLNGGVPVFASYKMPDYSIDWHEMRKLVNPRTRMIILNSPQNPTGQVLNAGDMEKLQKLVEQSEIILLSDEVYEHIIFDGYEHQSVARYPKLAARSFMVSSFGKTYHATGWKTGYVTAPATLMAEFRKVYQFMCFSSFTPVQHALNAVVRDADTYLGLAAFYQEKRDYFRQLMRDTRFKLKPCSGSYFQCASYEAITREDDLAFAARLTREVGVAAIPLSPFYHEGTDHNVLRFCFAKKKETLEQAVERLVNV